MYLKEPLGSFFMFLFDEHIIRPGYIQVKTRIKLPLRYPWNRVGIPYRVMQGYPKGIPRVTQGYLKGNLILYSFWTHPVLILDS